MDVVVTMMDILVEIRKRLVLVTIEGEKTGRLSVVAFCYCFEFWWESV